MRAFLSPTIALLIATGIVLSGCQRATDAKPEAAAAPTEQHPNTVKLTPDEIRQAGIQSAPAAMQDIAEPLLLTGTLTANQDKLAKVSVRLPGRVVAAETSLGQPVRAQQRLAELESIELGEAQAAYQQALGEAHVAEAGLTRAKRLAADDIIPQKDLLRAQADAQRAGAALRAAGDKLRMLGVAASEAPGARSRFPVVAPFAGTVIEKQAVIGTLVQADQPLFTIADLSTVWLEADVYEKDLAKLSTGVEATVTVNSYPGTAFHGKLTYLSAVMDKASRTVKARVEILNPDGKLRPGMFASVTLTTPNKIHALALPTEAIVQIQGKPAVFVADKDGFAPRAVETGPVVGGQTAIQAGVSAGDQVVVRGAYALKARLLKSQLGTED
ncbi:efflux RND transporter periplasmic adaptor subunit [Cupriavidus sp. TMH.W2]|uniref:efflux RND transporter periplasmic adaptor subunit n=1 Tax=Cupriavidus sp. TMH.W2 TaxID=3434465 RepID=UPI003D7744E8